MAALAAGYRLMGAPLLMERSLLLVGVGIVLVIGIIGLAVGGRAGDIILGVAGVLSVPMLALMPW